MAALLLVAAILEGAPAAAQAGRPAACSASQQCRQLALEAAGRGDYEAFHDLAWRAVQTGKRNDPALMYLLARAQALSGRPHDALVMLQRLADMGIASDAATNDDFRRTRELPGWAELAARLDRLNHPAATGAANALPSGAPAVPAPPPASAPPPPPAPAPPPAAPPAAPAPTTGAKADSTELAGRFSTPPFQLGGFAYDVVSGRFLFGDRIGRKLIVVGEGLNYAVDLVRSESAGFQQVGAVEIDEKRGDLWVASGAGGAGILHRLQLVSGRPLKSFPVPADYEPVDVVDLAVTPEGSVLALNAAASDLLVLPAGETAFAPTVPVDAAQPVSIAAASDERTAYVAHRDGVSRVDLRRRTAALVTAPQGTSIAGLERIRWFRNALIAVALDTDGSHRIIRLDLNGAGTAVTQAATIESGLPGGPTSVTISGNELIYVVGDSGGSGGRPSTPAAFAAYRVHLR